MGTLEAGIAVLKHSPDKVRTYKSGPTGHEYLHEPLPAFLSRGVGRLEEVYRDLDC